MNDSLSEMDQVISLSENLKQIHRLTTANYTDFDQLISEYLRSGLSIFGMKIGIVSEIKDDKYTIVDAISPDNSIKKGDVFELENTYCREVYSTREVLGFPYVGSMEDMKDHPVYVNMKLESYISAPIITDGVLFGTLNFTSTEVREHGFSEHERDLISLMANAIGSFLSLSQKDSELRSANDRLKRLVGYVAHDLRNPLGNIKGLIDFIPNSDPSQLEKIVGMVNTSVDKGFEIVSSVLETAAMGTGKIELHKEKVDLYRMIESICLRYQVLSAQRNVRFELNCSKNLEVTIDPHRMEQVFGNLLSNTLKYTSDDGVIQVVAKQLDDQHCEVLIENPISGFSSTNSKSDLNKSIGFGLEIVREILELHDSKLEISGDSDRFIARFVLPLN